MASLRNAITKRVSWAVLLLLVSMVAASVDAIPDPPAVAPHRVVAHVDRASVLPHPSNHQQKLSGTLSPAAPFPVWLRTAESTTEAIPVQRAAVLNRAADTSPPHTAS
jgi:hypothetical protein